MNSKLLKEEKEKLSDENDSLGENSNDKYGDCKLSVEVTGRDTKTQPGFNMSEIRTESDLKSKMDIQENKTNGMITEANVYSGGDSTRPSGGNSFNRNTDSGSNSSFLPRMQSSGSVGFTNNRFGAPNREGFGNYMHNIPQGPTPFCRGGPPLRFRMAPRPVLNRITFPAKGKVWQPHDNDDEEEETTENKDDSKKEENNKNDKDAKKINEEDKVAETEQKKQEDEEDIDLYGDIVTAADKSDNSGVEDEHSSYSALGPPPVPPAFLLNLNENVESYVTKINDKSEEYDPAEPWDSEDEMVIDENKEQTPERKEIEEENKKEEIKEANKKESPQPTPSASPSQKLTCSSVSPCKSTSPISPAQKLMSPEPVAAKSTFSSSPNSKITTVKVSDDDDDNDCPIFSIYSEATKKFSQKDDEERRLRSISVESENQILETKENKKVSKEKSDDKDKDLSWKKPSKKDKNYREGKKKSKERSESKGYERKKSRSLSPKKDKKKNKDRKRKTERKKELERYDVRKIVKNKEMRKTDAFGRDIISKSRSISRSPIVMPMRERSRNMLRRRSPSFSRSRSLTRSRSRSFRRRSLGRRRYNRSRTRSRSESLRRSYSSSKSRSRSRKSKKKFKPKERMKFRSRSRGRKSRSISRGRRRSVSRSRSRSPRVVRNKKRVRRSWSEVSRSPSFSPTRSRSVSLSPIRVRRSYSRSISTSWSRGRSPIPRAQSLEKLTVVLTTKNKKKKKKEWKKNRKEEKKRKRAGNSKEVFTSGDNVLVSVNFNNGVSDGRSSRLNSVSPEPTETRKKKKGSDNENEKSKKKSNAISKKAVDLALSGPTRVKKLTRLSEKDAEVILNRKPVAVIDLDMSPYREQTPSPVNVVVVSDSGSGDEGKEHIIQPVNPPHKGPNTPPAPRGPTTPKTPPSPQTSPDVYDPFEPTKSRSLSPSQADKENRPSPKPTDDQAPVADEGNETVSSSSDKDIVIEKESAKEILDKSEAVPIVESTPSVISSQTPVIDIAESPDRIAAVVISTPQKTQPPPQATFTSSLKPIPMVTTSTVVDIPPTSISLTVTSMPSPTKTSRVTTTTTQTLQVTGIQRLQDRLGSPVNRTPNSVKSTPEKRSDSNETLSSGNYKIRNAGKRNGDQPKQARPLQDATNETIDVPPASDDSPYSPASSEGDDLFDPPPETGKATQINSKPPLPYKPKPVHKDNTKPLSKFDLLFGPSLSPLMVGNKKPNTKVNSKFFPPSKKTGPVKKSVMHKMDEDQLKILDELPSSAVELQVKDKFLKKLNRQERVVDEVKTVLKPHYARKHITKEEYKDILRRSVPKICHSKSGEINPSKIQFLIEAYVKKCRHAKKKLTNTVS